MGRVCVPSPFGMCTRRTGGARYVPDFARSSSDRRLSSSFAAYSLRRLSVDARRAVLARAPVRLAQPVDVDVMGQRREAPSPASSFASSAIRSSFVETVFGARCLRHLSLQRFRVPAPPSLHGVPRVGSPASSATTRRSDFPPPLPLRFVSFARRYRRSPAAADDEASQVPGRTLCARAPALRPRWVRRARACSGRGPTCRASMLPSAHFERRRLHDNSSFEAQSHGPRARCLRFAATVARGATATQDSLPAGGPPLAGRDCDPLGRFVRFPPVPQLHGFLLTQALPGAPKHESEPRRQPEL